ncbi:zntR [Symbiodinium microadriaticum]|nr:zntR [Symbiodinium microadriaticum]
MGGTIGWLSHETGVKPVTIRWYEQEGLLPEPPRTEGGRRVYDARHRERLRFIRHGRAMGFSLDEVKDLLALQETPDLTCEEADAIASRHLERVEAKLKSLRALQRELKDMVTACGHGSLSDCRVIEVLSDHDLCLHDH